MRLTSSPVKPVGIDSHPASPPGRLQMWLLLIALVAVAGIGYGTLRPQIFTLLAAGTEWVLVTCGFVAPGADGEGMADDRLRRLYYASRMFEAVPPRALSPLDAWADKAYPGMGFGFVRTFDQKPVTLAIGGWLFSIPCTYFADARDCTRAGITTARLRVDTTDLAPLRAHLIPEFLATASPAILRVTLARATAKPPPPTDYNVLMVRGADGRSRALRCISAARAQQLGVLQHCLLTVQYSPDVALELYFAAALQDQWQRLEQGALALARQFQVQR